jgi:hypothetical protein
MLKTHIQPILAFLFNSNTDSNLFKFDQGFDKSRVAAEAGSTKQNQWRDYLVNQTYIDGVGGASKQGSSQQKSGGLGTLLQQIWNAVLTPDTEPRIQQQVDWSGQPYWRVYDPTTDREHTFFSEEDVYQWLERRYYE